MLSNPEVLVVGAGPAGSIAALVLARRGIRVMVIDRKARGEGKVCGEFVGDAGTRVLRRLGLLESVWKEGGLPIRRGRLWTPAGVSREAPLGRHPSAHGFALSRTRLDEALIGAARGAGATVQRGARLVRLGEWRPHPREVLVEHRGRQVRLHPNFIIGADGRSSVVACQAGLKGHSVSLGVGFQVHLHRSVPPPDTVDLLFADGFYSGLVPVERDRWCLGLLAPVRDGHLPRTAVSLLDDCLERWREASVLPIPDPVLDRASTYPVIAALRQAVAPGLLLAGDAAGSVDPLTGQGISLALESGVAAAGAAEQILQNSGSASRLQRGYQDYLNQKIGSRLLTCSPLRVLLARPRLAEAFLAGMGHVPGATGVLFWWARRAQLPRSALRAWPLLPGSGEGDGPEAWFDGTSGDA